eukprot:scaffold10856_cov229-Amphora_coffeaeformis.AAC.25
MNSSRNLPHAAKTNPVDIDKDIFSPTDYSGDYKQTQGSPVLEDALGDDFFGFEDDNCASWAGKGVSGKLSSFVTATTPTTSVGDGQKQQHNMHSNPKETDDIPRAPDLKAPTSTTEERPSSLVETYSSDNAISEAGGSKVNHKEGTLAKQVLLARMYQNRSIRNNASTGGSVQATENHRASQSPVGSKRVFQENSKDAEATTSSLLEETPVSSSVTSSISVDSLLHNSCKLYPTTLAIVKSALQFDPEAIRRAVRVETNVEDTSCTEPLLKKQKLNGRFAYPVNIAMSNKGSADVIDFLAKAAPDVLVLQDGPCQGSSVAIAIRSECDVSIIKAVLETNPDQSRVVDRLHDLPLHTALRVPTVSLKVVKLIHNAYPDALTKTNIRGDTPVQVAERNQYCKEDIVNYLQEHAYSPFEANAMHMDDVELEGL